MTEQKQPGEAPFEEPEGEPLPSANAYAEPCPSETPPSAPTPATPQSPAECPPANWR